MLNTSERLIWNLRCAHLSLAKHPSKYVGKYRQEYRRLRTRLYLELCPSLHPDLNLDLNLNLNPLLYRAFFAKSSQSLLQRLFATLLVSMFTALAFDF